MASENLQGHFCGFLLVGNLCRQWSRKRDSSTGVDCEFCKISKNTFPYRTPLIAASESCISISIQIVRLIQVSSKLDFDRP